MGRSRHSHRSIFIMLWDFLWVFWLLRLFRSICVMSCLSLSNYFNLEFICFSIPKLTLFFFLTVLLSLPIALSSNNLTTLLVYSNCYLWISFNSTITSRISHKNFDLFSSSFISFTNRAEMELSSSLWKGEDYLWGFRRWLLNVFRIFLWDFWLWLWIGNGSFGWAWGFGRSLDWGGEVHAKLFHCIFGGWDLGLNI